MKTNFRRNKRKDVEYVNKRKDKEHKFKLCGRVK